jgi:acyl-CoA thioesterase
MTEREPEGDTQQRAQAVGEAMYARDDAAKALGITLEAIGPGFARCRMPLRADMLNGHGTGHGGFVFTLADAAFAYACNSHDRRTVAQGAQITFIAPARQGEVLIATATERSRARRIGFTDVEVTTVDGRVLAYFRGSSYEVGGRVVPRPT